MSIMKKDKLESFEKFNYLLRPSKQVERKLFIEALHHMSTIGYKIAEYTYVGLGSVYYADFILFHKYLYINSMICAEASDIPKRMDFNKPFNFIDLKKDKISKVLPDLDRNLKYFVWLDYDYALKSEILQDVIGFLHILTPGSIFAVTVDAEPRLPEDIESESMTRDQLIDRRVRELTEEFGNYYPGKIKRKLYSYKKLPRFFATVLINLMQEAMTRRPGLGFLQLFNFKYADGAQMLTIGGLIDEVSAIRRVKRSDLFRLEFITDKPEPIPISVPPLTIREKQCLDQMLKEGLQADDLPFELREEILNNFRKYYRHYPTYYETLI